jgi:hypothetical protein
MEGVLLYNEYTLIAMRHVNKTYYAQYCKVIKPYLYDITKTKEQHKTSEPTIITLMISSHTTKEILWTIKCIVDTHHEVSIRMHCHTKNYTINYYNPTEKYDEYIYFNYNVNDIDTCDMNHNWTYKFVTLWDEQNCYDKKICYDKKHILFIDNIDTDKSIYDPYGILDHMDTEYDVHEYDLPSIIIYTNIVAFEYCACHGGYTHGLHNLNIITDKDHIPTRSDPLGHTNIITDTDHIPTISEHTINIVIDTKYVPKLSEDISKQYAQYRTPFKDMKIYQVDKFKKYIHEFYKDIKSLMQWKLEEGY